MSGRFDKFGKLLKYDFLESFYSIALINVILLVLMAISKMIIMDSNTSTFAWLILLMVIPIGFFLSIVFLAFTIIRLLYNRLFTSDGYLTFALPVSLDAVLMSKILVSSLYVILSGAVIFLWAIVLILDSQINVGELVGLVNATWVNAMIDSPYFTILPILNSITSIFATATLVLLILAILHIGAITRFRVLCGIALFLVFTTIEGAVSACVANVFIDDNLRNNSLQNLWAFVTIFNMLKTAIYYYFTRYLIANKLEI